jgi:hypothetical protein
MSTSVLSAHAGQRLSAVACLCHSLENCLGIEFRLLLTPAILARQYMFRGRLRRRRAAASQTHICHEGSSDAH